MLLAKEPELARHQSGRNSGILHSGLYYTPGSLKARFTREGRRRLLAFCAERGIRHEVCGKVVVAATAAELPALAALQARAAENEVGRGGSPPRRSRGASALRARGEWPSTG